MKRTEYQQQSQLPPCLLNREDLVNLYNLIGRDFDKEKAGDPDVWVYADLRDRTVRASSIGEFLETEGLPHTLDRMTIRFACWNSEVARTCGVTFYKSFISVEVDGLSNSWVIGKHSEVVAFLRGKKPWWAFLKWGWFNTILSVLPGMILGWIGAELILREMSLLVVWAMFVGFIFALVNYSISRLPHTRIVLKEPVTFFQKYHVQILLILTILTILVPLVLWILDKTVFKSA